MEKFPLIMLTKLTGCRPSRRGHFWPHGHNVKKLSRGSDTKYQGSRSNGFRLEVGFFLEKITTVKSKTTTTIRVFSLPKPCDFRLKRIGTKLI